MALTDAPPLDEGMILFAKAGPGGDCMGDCPFTQKANLALRFKKADFKVHFIDLSNKPAWFLDLNEEGSTPVFVDGTHAIGESDEIVEYADKIGTEKSLTLTREDDALWDSAFDAVSPIFGGLVRLLRNKDDAQELSLKDTLSSSLVELDGFLAKTEGPFLLGDSVCALDCNLAPKLKHLAVAASHYKGFEIPAQCTNVAKFMTSMYSSDEWQATACTDDVIIWGWSKFFS